MKTDSQKRSSKKLANKLYLWFIAFLFSFGVIKGIYIFANLFPTMITMARHQDSYVPIFHFMLVLFIVSGPSIIIAIILFFLYYFFWKNENSQCNNEVYSDDE